MKKFLLSITAAAALLPATAYAATEPHYSFTFQPESILASGKWVKIHTMETGIYEISYDRLRELGFSDPEKVCIYGSGGQMQPVNFMNYSSQRTYYDNPRQVATIHREGKIYFYAQGMENISYNANLKRYARGAINIYTDKGAYFLTEGEPLGVQAENLPADVSATQRRTGLLGYVYHEKELRHNFDGTGRLYWGEDLKGVDELRFPFHVPFAMTDADDWHKLEAGFQISPAFSGSPSLKIGVGDTSSTLDCNVQQRAFKTKVNEDIRISPSKSDNVVITPTDFNMPYGALDYWILTYKMDFTAGNSADFVQESGTFPTDNTIESNSPAYFNVIPGSIVLDVTNPYSINELKVEDDRAIVADGRKSRRIVAFNPLAVQKQILPETGDVTIANIHAGRENAPELLIISVPQYRAQAEQIAELHLRNDGIHSVVVTPDELYNEFSSGIPDPMAYRAAAKALYQKSGRKLKNILLFGPIYADIRNVTGEPERQPGIIAYQLGNTDLNMLTSCDLDYYGTLTDYFSTAADPCSKTVELGVGILHVSDGTQAALAVNKIRDYMEKNDFAYLANEYMMISCPGDERLHDMQADDIGRNITKLHRDLSGAPAAMEYLINAEYGQKKASDRYISMLGQGKLFNTYFGHAGLGAYGGSETFMNVTKLRNLDNRNLGFTYLAGCELSMPDIPIHGVGDVCVISSPRAFVGAIQGTRTVQSNYNYDLCLSFFRNLFYDNYRNGTTNRLRTVSPTIGEVYAQAKTREANPSELSYMYIGDPALKVPIPTRRIQATTSAVGGTAGGEIITVDGYVCGTDGKKDESYNGHAYVKIMEPLNSIDIKRGNEPFLIDYSATHHTAVKVEVKNGAFTAKAAVPASFDAYRTGTEETPETFKIYLSAYDPSTQIASAGMLTVPLLANGETSTASEPDTESPEFSLKYTPEIQALEITASDNAGFLRGIGRERGVRLTIDGRESELTQSGDDGTVTESFSTILPVMNLAEGNHRVKGYACDLAGNISKTAEITFKKNDADMKLTLTPLDMAVLDTARFRVEGLMTEGLTFVVIDSEGNIVHTATTDGDPVWEVGDAAPGIYRAAVYHDSEKGALLHSGWTEFSVIE